MRATVALRSVARTPLIRFVGRRSVPRTYYLESAPCNLFIQ
jgi:hypothetical protein